MKDESSFELYSFYGKPLRRRFGSEKWQIYDGRGEWKEFSGAAKYAVSVARDALRA